jgi:hypothetical protein
MYLNIFFLICFSSLFLIDCKLSFIIYHHYYVLHWGFLPQKYRITYMTVSTQIPSFGNQLNPQEQKE